MIAAVVGGNARVVRPRFPSDETISIAENSWNSRMEILVELRTLNEKQRQFKVTVTRKAINQMSNKAQPRLIVNVLSDQFK